MKFRTVLLASVMSMSMAAVAASAESSPSATSATNSSMSSGAQQMNLSSEQESKIKTWWASQNKDKDKAAVSTTASTSMVKGSTIPSSTQLQSFPSDLGISNAQYVENGKQLCVVNPSNRTVEQCLQ